MSRAGWLVAVASCWCMLAVQAWGDPIVLHNTGEGSSWGDPDPNYSLVAGPYGAHTLSVVYPYGFPFLPSLWTTAITDAQWIAPQTHYEDFRVDPAGMYWYQTTFDLTGLIPATAVISGLWASDDCGEIYLNGVPTGQTTSSTPYCLARPHPFTLTSGFVAGINTLSFLVENYSFSAGNPTGIIVSLSGTAEHAPEPVAVGLLGSGLLCLWLLRRRIVQG